MACLFVNVAINFSPLERISKYYLGVLKNVENSPAVYQKSIRKL